MLNDLKYNKSVLETWSVFYYEETILSWSRFFIITKINIWKFYYRHDILSWYMVFSKSIKSFTQSMNNRGHNKIALLFFIIIKNTDYIYSFREGKFKILHWREYNCWLIWLRVSQGVHGKLKFRGSMIISWTLCMYLDWDILLGQIKIMLISKYSTESIAWRLEARLVEISIGKSCRWNNLKVKGQP